MCGKVLLVLHEPFFFGSARMLPRKAPHSHRARVRLTSFKTTVHRHYKLARANRSSHGRDVFTDDRSAWSMMSVVNCHDDRQKKDILPSCDFSYLH